MVNKMEGEGEGAGRMRTKCRDMVAVGTTLRYVRYVCTFRMYIRATTTVHLN